MSEKFCLICGDVSAKNTLGSTIPGWTENAKSCTKMEHELSVVLLLRNVLGLSYERLKSLLQNFGNPTEWGISLCCPCNRVFTELQFLHSRLTKIHAEFDELAIRLRKQFKESVVVGSTSGLSTRCKQGRNYTGRGRTRKKPQRIVRNHNVTPEQLPVSIIREEVSKGTPETTVQVDEDSCPTLDAFEEGKILAQIIKQEHDTDNSINTDQQVTNTEHSEAITQGSCEDEPTDLPLPLDEDYCQDDDDENLPSPSSASKEDGADDSDSTTDNDNDQDLDYECGSKSKNKSVTRNIPPKRKQIDKTDDFDPFSVPQPVKFESGYKCPLCGRRALSKIISHGHILRFHCNEKKPYPCHLCPNRFKRDVQLRQHLEMEHNNAETPLDDPEERHREKLIPPVNIPPKINSRAFECDICPKTKYKVLYQSQETLDAHKKMKHLGIPRPYTCKLCGKGFKLQTMLRCHLYTHQRWEKEKKTTFKKPSCDQCGLSFKTMEKLRQHLRTKLHSKTQEYPFQCELCPKGFYQKPSLENHHAQEHYKELNLEPFKCTFCGSILSSQRALDHHIRIIHTKDTTYRCESCDLGFMHNNNYKRHMAFVHAKEKPLLCSYCPKRFSVKNHLETHLRTHTGEKPYKCTHCPKEYSDRPTFRRHLETHGEQEYECSICENKRFKVWHSYRNHMKTHNQEVPKKWRNWQKLSLTATSDDLKKETSSSSITDCNLNAESSTASVQEGPSNTFLEPFLGLQ